MKFQLALTLLVALTTVNITRADTNPELFGAQEHAFEASVSSKGNLLVVANEDTGFQVWSVASRQPLWKSDSFFLTISRDEKFVLVASNAQPEDNELRDLTGVRFDCLDARDGHLLHHIEAPHPQETNDDDPDELVDYSLSPDGSTLRLATQKYLHVIGINEGVVQSQRWASGKTYVRLRDATFSALKNELIGLDLDDRISLFDADSGVQLRRFAPDPAFKFPEDVGVSLDVSPDGFSFVENPDVDETQSHLFRLSDGKLLWRPTNWPLFSDDGKRAYVLTKAGVDTLDAHTGKKLQSMRGPQDELFDVSPDEKWIYEARDDKIYRWPIGSNTTLMETQKGVKTLPRRVEKTRQGSAR